MNTNLKTYLAATLLFFTACQKENISNPVSTSSQESLANDSIYIGAHYQGGIIFWIDSTGQHGLIAAPADYRDRAIFWANWASGVEYAETGAKGKKIGSGKGNTRKILISQGKPFATVPYAAQVCHKLELDEYDDWYLPSVDELMEMYYLRDIIGNFGSDRAYWTSTEFDGTRAYRIYFGTTPLVSYYDKINWHWVRAIRTF
jgi:hypothetical protein